MQSTTTPITNETTLTAGQLLVHNKGGDSLFGKIVRFVRKEGEMILVEFGKAEEKVETWLHISQAKVPVATPTTPATPATPATTTPAAKS